MTQPTHLGSDGQNTGQSTPGGVTVTPDEPLPSDVSIGVKKLSQPPTCPSATPGDFKAESPALYWQIETSPPGTPVPATVCFNYLPTTLSVVQQCGMRLYNGNETTCDWGSAMGDVCPSNGNFCGTGTPCTSATRSAGTICGHVDHFSPFGLFTPELADIPTVTVPPPMIVAVTTVVGVVVTFAASAHDADDGTLAAQCTRASGSTFPLGKTTVVCSATDSQGFRGQASFTVWVQVQAPTDGTFFLFPIRPDGSSLFRVGRPVPVRFRLTGASKNITDLVAKVVVTKICNSVTGNVPVVSDETVDDTDFTFKYRPLLKWYVYRWKTRDQTQGTYQIKAVLGDGVDHVVNVSLK